jgi:hypothetical protein
MPNKIIYRVKIPVLKRNKRDKKLIEAGVVIEANGRLYGRLDMRPVSGLWDGDFCLFPHEDTLHHVSKATMPEDVNEPPDFDNL